MNRTLVVRGINRMRETAENAAAERRSSLYAFVGFFNHEQVHGTLSMTPTQKLAQYAKRQESGDNAV